MVETTSNLALKLCISWILIFHYQVRNLSVRFLTYAGGTFRCVFHLESGDEA